MADHTGEKMRGHAKEAAGDMTDDKDLKREGKVDRASASVKDTVSDAADAVKDAVNKDRR